MKKIILLMALIIAIIPSNVYAVSFVNDLGGIYCIKDDGTQAKSEWIDYEGKSYYFGADHFLKVNYLAPDGYRTDDTGAWDGKEAEKTDKTNAVVARNSGYFNDANNTTSFQNEEKKKALQSKIEDVYKKIVESNEKLKEYTAKGMPQEIIDTVMQNINLYKENLNKLEKELEVLGGKIDK